MTTALAPSLFKMHDGVNGINTSMQSNTSSSSSSSQEENGMKLDRHQNDHTPVTRVSCNQNENENDDERMQEEGKQTNPKSIHNNKGEPKIFMPTQITNLSLSLEIEALLRLFLIHSTYQKHNS